MQMKHVDIGHKVRVHVRYCSGFICVVSLGH